MRKLRSRGLSWREERLGSITLKRNNRSVRQEGGRGVITSLEVEEEVEEEVGTVDEVEEEGMVEGITGDRGISLMEVINGNCCV